MSATALKISTVRDRLRERHNEREHHLQLEREIAAYDTPTARAELEAILSRYTPEDTRHIDAILVTQPTRV